jgi:hypothetical protein
MSELPAADNNAAYKFTGHRHVPLAARMRIYVATLARQLKLQLKLSNQLLRSRSMSLRSLYEEVNPMPNNTRPRCASFKIPPNTLPIAKLVAGGPIRSCSLSHLIAANAPLAASRTCGSIFAGGLWGPKGVLVPQGLQGSGARAGVRACLRPPCCIQAAKSIRRLVLGA